MRGDTRIRAKVRFRLVNWPLQLRWSRVLARKAVPGLVSIITPTHQRHQKLKEAIESVRGQSISNWEMIVVCDGHDPKAQEIVNKLGDCRVRYFRSNRVGYYGNHQRNAGTLQSRGEFIFYLDDDNLLKEHALVSFLAGFLETDAGFVVCPIQYGEKVMMPTQALELKTVDTLNFMIRRHALRAVGGWKWFLAADHDLITRVSHGFQGVYCQCPPIGVHR